MCLSKGSDAPVQNRRVGGGEQTMHGMKRETRVNIRALGRHGQRDQRRPRRRRPCLRAGVLVGMRMWRYR